MSVKEKGKIVFKSEIKEGVSKSGNSWANQTIVIEVSAGYNAVKRVALRAGSKILEECEKFPVGSIVEVEYNVTAREWEGKWYNDVDLWGIEATGKSAQAAASAPQAPAPQAPAPQQNNGNYEPQPGDLPWD